MSNINQWMGIIIIIFAFLFIVQTWFYVERIWDIKQKYYRDLNTLEKEYAIQDQMLKNLTLPQVMIQEDR